jgi:hypothetical protein
VTTSGSDTPLIRRAAAARSGDGPPGPSTPTGVGTVSATRCPDQYGRGRPDGVRRSIGGRGRGGPGRFITLSPISIASWIIMISSSVFPLCVASTPIAPHSPGETAPPAGAQPLTGSGSARPDG